MGRVPTLKNPIFVALDLDDDVQAVALAKKLVDWVGGFKLGPRLTYKYGLKLVQNLAKIGPVFVDNKYHDIPNTVLAAIRSTYDGGASFATVHASNGFETLKQLAILERQLSDDRPFKVLSVTVLTSFNEKNLPKNWIKQTPNEHVKVLAKETLDSGLTGLVCSPEELKFMRESYPQAFLVAPGIRLPDDSKDDQARTMGPSEALATGASALVIGRPIINARDPIAAARKFSETISLI